MSGARSSGVEDGGLRWLQSQRGRPAPVWQRLRSSRSAALSTAAGAGGRARCCSAAARSSRTASSCRRSGAATRCRCARTGIELGIHWEICSPAPGVCASSAGCRRGTAFGGARARGDWGSHALAMQPCHLAAHAEVRAAARSLQGLCMPPRGSAAAPPACVQSVREVPAGIHR